MKKHLRTAAAVLATSLVLAACGGDGDVTPPTNPGGTAAPTSGTSPSTEPGGEPGDDDEGALVIDGELIADAELWAAAQEEGHILFYGTFAPAVTEAMIAEFTADTGITVEHIRLQSPPMHERVLSELGANQLEADVIDFTSISLVTDIYENDVYEPHRVPSYDDLPEELIHFDGAFYTVSRPLFGIAYNTAFIDEADWPETWEDLADERWRGEIGLTTIASDNNWGKYILLYDVFGEDYWRRLADLEPRFYESVAPLSEELVRGEITIGLGHVGTTVQAIKDGAPLRIVLPPEGIPAPHHTAGVSRHAKNPNAAKVFLNWRLSVRGSQVFADASAEYPSNPGHITPDIEGTVIPHPSEAYVYSPTIEDLTTRRDELGPLWSEIFGR